MKARTWLLLSLLASGISGLYMYKILLPWEYFIDVERGRLIAQMGDLYPRWVGTRELLLNGRNPYGPEVSHEIQTAFYGHPVVQTYGDPRVDPIDEQRFAYPVYIVFLLAPTVPMNFSHLNNWAPVIFAFFTAISVLVWLDVLRYRPPKLLTAAIVLFVVSSPQIAQGLRLRQLGLMVAFLLVLGAWLVARNHLALAGVILAISTVKPQMVVLPLIWFLFWSISAWKKRWPLLAGFGVTITALAGLGAWLLPEWPRDFVDGIIAYRKYFPKPSLLSLALGEWVGALASAVVLASIFFIAWRNQKANANSPKFIQTLALFFIAADVVLPPLLTPFNQVLLLLPILMLVRDWTTLPRVGRSLFAATLAWPSLCSFALLWLHPRLDSTRRIPLLPSASVMLIPFLTLILLAMIWNRSESHLTTTSMLA
jgi:hypothetical protein